MFCLHLLRVEAVFTSMVNTEQGMKVSVDSSTTNLVFPEFQGTLSVMLICTVLEFCLAVLAAVVWWKKAHSTFTGVSVLTCLPKSCQVYLQFWVVLSNVSKTGRRVSSCRKIHMRDGNLMGVED